MLRDLMFVNGFNVKLMDRMTADVPEERFYEQLPGLPNHPGWQVGHVTFVRASVARALGRPGPVDPERLAWAAPNSAPKGGAEGHPGKAELLAMYRAAQEHLAAVVGGLDEATLESPSPERMRERFPTVRNLLFGLLGPHDALHLGQLSTWRRAAGYPRVL